MLRRTVSTNLSLNERLTRLERKAGMNSRNNRSFKEARSAGVSASKLVSIVRNALRTAPEEAFSTFGLNPENYSDNTQEFIDAFGLDKYGFVSFYYLEDLADRLRDEGKEFSYEGYFINIDPVDEEDAVEGSESYEGDFFGRNSRVTAKFYKSRKYAGEYLGDAFYLTKVNGSTTW